MTDRAMAVAGTPLRAWNRHLGSLRKLLNLGCRTRPSADWPNPIVDAQVARAHRHEGREGPRLA